ncbi:ATP-binding cassette domain-containing protein [Acidaminobacter hydrogenoformans]|uniref:UvrABC system protein A n=1 Tax=Acidaminobacter hydrogenoformans DSM 2784 TaxID=1120920 RepID=A0A1G5S3I9_9FIRM|nr:excinuclease ABC subunit UvrA [Acidaminobacter hydrogenoformans]SCZ80935.1 excinuclease ABC, A subunit [Acidaminobacter hydrogenoformans DSM 2784]
MKPDQILIHNARTHNLKSISLTIPKNKLVVFTGVSGSGKSSLVFDTIYTEAQRQLIETFSSFARERMPKLSRPDVDDIQNLSTAIVIDQKRMGTTMRSTVGTATELYTYLRLLFSRCGEPFIGPSFVFGFNHPAGMCPECHGLGKRIKVDVAQLLDLDKTIREGGITHPDHKVGGWNWREMVAIDLFDVDKKLRDFSEEEINKLLYAKDIPISRAHGAGTYAKTFNGIAERLERDYLNKAPEELPAVKKDAYQRYFSYMDCDACHGSRINDQARSVKVNGKTIPDLIHLEFTALLEFLDTIDHSLAQPILKKMKQILCHLIEIGVGYLSLNRSVATLSGGESQRVKMAKQLDCDLVDLMYILDEPSIGLHPRDTDKLVGMLVKLRDKGNSVFFVEHDPDMILRAEYAIDIGPKAGSHGGEVVYAGPVKGLLDSAGLTGEYLRHQKVCSGERKPHHGYIEIKNASLHNLKNVSTKIPKGVLTCITGVAGSGKSSLILETFLKQYKDAVVIDQSAIGKNSRSNPATYTGIFDLIRKEFAQGSNSSPSLFSFNSSGACPKCNGLGVISYEMHFMDAVKVTCEECQGKRYTEEVLSLKYKDKNIHEVLITTLQELRGFFDHPEINRKLEVLCEVGLGYLELGQPLSTLSGGEAQRIKLASELQKKGNIYVMDEPTTGLHMADIERLLDIIKHLVAHGNTVIVIEHNLEVIGHADWIIDLGPEGGAKGGEILFEGTPEDLMDCQRSYTGQYLKKLQQSEQDLD